MEEYCSEYPDLELNMIKKTEEILHCTVCKTEVIQQENRITEHLNSKTHSKLKQSQTDSDGGLLGKSETMEGRSGGFSLGPDTCVVLRRRSYERDLGFKLFICSASPIHTSSSYLPRTLSAGR